MMKTARRAAFVGAGLAALLVFPAQAQGPATPQADVRAGIAAWQAGDHATAVARWRPLAERGDADAQFNLAQAYKLGRGVPMDLRQAQTLYERAARQGHEQAQANLGLILFQNGQRREAMPWIEQAARSGDPRAQYVYGTALFNGDLVARDWPRAYALMTRASAQGLPPAASQLTEMDRHLSAAEKAQGVALARQMETAPPTRTAEAAPTRPTTAPASRPPAAQTPARPAPAAQAPTAQAPAAPPPAARAPAPRPAPAAQAPAATPAPAATASGWRVQLGAFGNADNARRHWSDVSGRVSALLGAQPAYVRAGALTRVQAGPFASRAAADRACAAVRAAGSACLIVAP